MAELSSEKDRDIIRLWRVYNTSRQMLCDRGYAIDFSELNVPLDEFRTSFVGPDGVVDRHRMNFSLDPTEAMIEKYTDPVLKKRFEDRGSTYEVPLGTVRVEFYGDAQLGVKTIRTFAHRIVDESFYTGIAITLAPVSSQAVKIAGTIAPKILEFFQETDLVVNITMHELVPKHVLLSIEEKNQLLERYRLRESQLPRIQKNDPVAKYLGLRRGQVVKIIRKSTTAGRYASYRWVMG